MSFDQDTRSVRAEQAVDWERWSYTATGRMPPAWRTALREDPNLRNARLVIDMVYGRSKRVTVSGGLVRDEIQEQPSKPFQVSSARDGSVVTIYPALIDEPELLDEISIGPAGVSAGARTLSVSVAGELIDPKGIIASGWPMYGQAEVSLIYPGMDWDQRFIWMRGNITGSSHGGLKEIVQISIVDPVFSAPEVPPWVLDSQRFPNIDDSAIGERAPIVINGAYRSPCLRVAGSADGVAGLTHDFLLAAGHGFTLDGVFVNGATVGATYYSLTETVDGLGLPVSLVRFGITAGVSFWSEDNAAVYSRVTASDIQGNGVIQSAQLLLQNYGEGPRRRLSLRLFGEAETRIGQVGYTPSTRLSPYIAINAPLRAQQYLTETLFDEYPMIALAWENQGMGPIVIDSRAEPVIDLTPGIYPAIDRAEGTNYRWVAQGEIRNRFTYRYWYDALEDEYRRVVTRNPENSSLCAWSQGISEEQPDEERFSITITDDATANFCIDWLVEHLARPACEVTLDFYPEAWFLLRRGDALKYTDPKVGFSEERALVVSRRWKQGAVEMTIRIFPELINNNTGGGSRSFSPI